MPWIDGWNEHTTESGRSPTSPSSRVIGEAKPYRGLTLINADQEIKISPRRRGGAEKINADVMATVFEDTRVQFSRITINPRQMGGVPCIRNLRIPVATVLDMVAEGMEAPEILKTYPDLEAEDIREALCFAAERA